MKKVALKLNKLSIPLIIRKALNIILQMTGNADFPNPQPALADVQNAANDASAAFIAAENGTPEKTAEMYEKVRELKQLLTGLAGYVEFIANQDAERAVEMILSAGMEVKQQGSLNIPILAAKPGLEGGSVKLRRKAVTGSAYVWQFSQDGDSWTDAGESTVSIFTITGLQSEKRYWFRVATVKRQTQSAWSDPVTFVVS